MKALFLLGALCVLGAALWARPAASVRTVRRVYDGGARGDGYFNSHLRAEMRSMGIRFVAKKQGADAILKSSGQGTSDGGFSGFASLVSPEGRVLWSARVRRESRSNVMAFDSLAAKLRAARR